MGPGILDAEFGEEFFPGSFVLDDLLKFLPEIGNVPQWTLQGFQGVSQGDQLPEFGNLLDDGVGVEILEAPELQGDAHVFGFFSGLSGFEVVGDGQVKRELVAFKDVVEVVLVHIDGLDFLELAVVFFLGEVSDHELLEGQFDFFLCISRRRAVDDIDSFLGGDRTLIIHDSVSLRLACW